MSVAVVWFRQDLRLTDNPAFMKACSEHEIVIPLYIHTQTSVLGEAQAWWLHHSLLALKKSLHKKGLKLILRQGEPLEILIKLIQEANINAMYWNRCYEPVAIERDKKIKATLVEKGVQVHSSNGSVFHEPWTIQNKQGDFYKVFTPYWKHCRQLLHQALPPFKSKSSAKGKDIASDTLEAWNLLPALPWAERFSERWMPGEEGAHKKLEEFLENHLKGYKANRDFPAQQATSYLSPHLHFGEISPWAILRAVENVMLEPSADLASIEHFLSELGWREFSVYLLYHFPKLPTQNFKKEFDAFPWYKNKSFLKRWQQGMTGYPLVDAGMRELWATGYMHNRVRMIVASFLTKGLLIDWRVGAAWFLQTLVDADLANNSASWQWVAGCGVDAAPYFRIFNPTLQSQKFDSEGEYIRTWVPELAKVKGQAIHAPWDNEESKRICIEQGYPEPMINHSEARVQALEFYKQL